MAGFKVDRFTLDILLGEGNFGWVYKAKDKISNTFVAIKIEKSSKNSQISNEVSVLQSLKGEPGFPYVIDFGVSDNKAYLAIPFLGENLNKKLSCLKRLYSSETLMSLGKNCLERISTLHKYYYLHRDLKPHQFLVDDELNVSLIDFGLSRRFTNPKLMIHIPFSDNRAFVGTANYASLNTHNGIQQSRRDDLESFCYILSYMLNGMLPWIPKTKEKYDMRTIKKLKYMLKPSELFSCQSLVLFYTYVKNLSFEQNPDYQYLNKLMDQACYVVKSNNPTSYPNIELTTTNSQSKKLRKRRKKTHKRKMFKRSNQCRSLDDIQIFLFDPSKTHISDHLPEFKNREFLPKFFKSLRDKNDIVDKINCVLL